MIWIGIFLIIGAFETDHPWGDAFLELGEVTLTVRKESCASYRLRLVHKQLTLGG